MEVSDNEVFEDVPGEVDDAASKCLNHEAVFSVIYEESRDAAGEVLNFQSIAQLDHLRDPAQWFAHDQIEMLPWPPAIIEINDTDARKSGGQDHEVAELQELKRKVEGGSLLIARNMDGMLLLLANGSQLPQFWDELKRRQYDIDIRNDLVRKIQYVPENMFEDYDNLY